MLSVGLSTLRQRWGSFAGAFVALALGGAILATMALVIAATTAPAHRGPGPFARAPVVVWVPAALHVRDGHGAIQAQPLAGQPAVPATVIRRVAAVARVTEYRTFYAQVVGPPSAARSSLRTGPAGEVGHAWPDAAYGEYRLIAGHAPAADDQVVVSGPARPGERVTVLTADGPRPYVVSGVSAPVSFESAVFFTSTEAARLSPHVDALVADGSVGAVRRAASGTARVLTGAARYQADPGAAQDADVLAGLATLLSVAALVAGFVAVFVVASTFNFAITQRRRELELLRAVGATPGQVRQMVLGEAAVVGAAGAAAGCALGLAGGPLLASWLARHALAPRWFTVTVSGPSLLALFIAFALMLAVAVLAAVAASLRAGVAPPLAGLREAAVHHKAMTTGRLLTGLVTLGAGALTIGAAVAFPAVATDLRTYATAVLLLLAGTCLLCPVPARWLVRLATWPAARLRGPAGSLVRENTLAAVRHTAAAISPVLLTVGLGAAVVGAATSVAGAQASVARQQVSGAQYVVTPDGTPGLSQAAIRRVQAIPGIQAAPAAATMVYARPATTQAWLQGDIAVLPYAAEAVTPAGLSHLMRLRVSAGSVSNLNNQTIIVDRSWNRKVGDVVRLWLADGSPVTLRVAAVLATGAGPTSAFVTPPYARAALASQIYVKLTSRADRQAVMAALGAATHGLDARVVTLAQWTDATDAAAAEQNWLALIVIVFIAVAYGAIAIVNTLAMAVTERRRDLALYRLAGATRVQVLRILAAEAVVVIAAGITLAAVVTAITFAGLVAALHQLTGTTLLSIPWQTVGVTTAACAAAALLGYLLPGRIVLQARLTGLAGIRE